MQVTPEAGRDTAKRFGVSYDWERMVSDPVYNAQMGGAELSALLREYNGSHILTFAAYNAGRGRVQQWVKQHGDPRAANVDAVDWVERIPFAETRNYVQRVMENLQVYRARFDPDAPVLSELNAHHTVPEVDFDLDAVDGHIDLRALAQSPVNGFILRDASLRDAPQDEVSDPHGEERAFARLEP